MQVNAREGLEATLNEWSGNLTVSFSSPETFFLATSATNFIDQRTERRHRRPEKDARTTTTGNVKGEQHTDIE